MMEKQIEDWLHDYNSIIAFVRGIESEMDGKATDGMGLAYDKDNLSKTYKFSSVVEDAVVSNEKLAEMVAGNKNLLNKIDGALMCLNEAERKIIIYKCIDNRFYYTFTNEVHFCERTCKRFKKSGIVKMRKAIYGL